MSPNRRRGARGFTLLELMVAGVIGLIVVGAAGAVFLMQRRLYQQAERKLGIHRDLTIAAALLQRDLENVGYKWPAPAFAVRINDQLAAALPNGDGTTVPVVANIGVNTAGVIAGTDAVDVWLGNPNGIAGTVLGVVGLISQVTTINLTSLDPLSAADQIFAQVPNHKGPLLLFTNTAGTNTCLAQVKSYVQTIPVIQLTVEMTDSNLNPIGFPSGLCPQASMSVYALQDRHRYFVYQQASGVDVGLYVQRMLDPANTQRVGILGAAPTLLVGGIEDMQVAWRLQNGAGDPLGCGQALCFCLLVPGGDCDPTGGLPAGANMSLIRGARINLVSRGEAGTATLASDLATQVQGARPAAFNNPAGPVDGYFRDQILTSVFFRNLSIVSP